MVALGNQVLKVRKYSYGAGGANIASLRASGISIATTSNPGQLTPPPTSLKRRSSIHRRRPPKMSADSGIFGLCRGQSLKEIPRYRNNSEQGTQNLISHTRTGSLSAIKRVTNHKRSNSIPTRFQDGSLFPKSSLFNRRFGFGEDFDAYDPLHFGPHITVSSADGTQLYADGSAQLRDAAAQNLYRAIQRRSYSRQSAVLEGHLDKILGAVEMNLEVRNIGARTNVRVVRKEWEADSVCGVMEGRGGKVKMMQKMTRKIKGKVCRWVEKVAGNERRYA